MADVGQERAEKLLQARVEDKEEVVPLDKILQEEADLSQSQLELILKYLQSTKQAMVFDVGEHKVKIICIMLKALPKGVKLSKKTVEPLNEVDKGRVQLMLTEVKLDKQIAKLEMDTEK